MPLLDKPLHELLQYPGRNARPADFDAFWDRSLQELDRLDPKVELRPNPMLRVKGVECFDLFFTGTGGARVHAKYLRPEKAPGSAAVTGAGPASRTAAAAKLPALLFFHGYSGHSGDWMEKLAYAGQGFCVAALDCRGQSGESEDVGGVKGNTLSGHIIRGLADGPDKLLFRHLFLDTALLARIVMAFPEVDEGRVGATGWSQGGGLTLACAALEPRIKKAAPVYPFLCDYRRVWEMDLAKDAYDELRKYFRYFDPLHEREEETFERLGYIDAQHLAPRIRAEVFLGVGLMDAICPPSTQFAAYNKIPGKKNLAVYPDFGHEGLPGHHDRIFNFFADL